MLNRMASHRDRKRRRVALTICAVFVVSSGLVASLVQPLVTEAAWMDAEVAQAHFSAGTLPAPNSLACQTQAGGLLGTDKAHVSWNTSASLPPGAKYEIVMQKVGGAAGTLPLQTERQITVVPGLLDSLLGLVLNLLSPPAEYSVKVSVVYPGTQWRSMPSTPQSVRYTGALLGLLGGFQCLS
jgi:hypothetical protein